MSFGLTQDPAYFTAVTQKVLGSVTDLCFFQKDDVLADNFTEDHLKVSGYVLRNWRSRIEIETFKMCFL